MYYQEKWIAGKLMCRTTPGGTWKEVSLETYRERLQGFMTAYLESRETEDRKWTTSDLEEAFHTGKGSSPEYTWFDYLQETQEKK